LSALSAKVVAIRAAAPSLDTRDRLVLNHLALVSQIAAKLKARLPPCFELDDLVQAGMLGLLEAASQYDPARWPGVAFGAFARRRIKGEIQDSIGMHTAESQRTTRRRRWDEATRPPIAEHDRPTSNIQDPTSVFETPDPAARADALLERRQRLELVKGAIRSLPKRQAKVIALHYGPDDEELRKIARTEGLAVGAARVSQLHTGALRSMRTYFELRGLKRAA
jgi:RNA polymerase sigma factor for flagellar operon FliA